MLAVSPLPLSLPSRHLPPGELRSDPGKNFQGRSQTGNLGRRQAPCPWSRIEPVSRLGGKGPGCLGAESRQGDSPLSLPLLDAIPSPLFPADVWLLQCGSQSPASPFPPAQPGISTSPERLLTSAPPSCPLDPVPRPLDPSRPSWLIFLLIFLLITKGSVAWIFHSKHLTPSSQSFSREPWPPGLASLFLPAPSPQS